MAVFCCCTTPRSSKARNAAIKEQTELPVPPPLVRLPGPLTLNPVVPTFADPSPNLQASTLPSAPATIVPIDPVELGQLVVEDSDSDDELDSRTHTKSTSTLQLVRTHLRRHLSQDSLPRRKSRSAVGSSQEEIERRAELKRLMHKRIQEELRTEEGQGTIQSDVSSSHQRGGPSIEILPGGGPRDNLEFSVTEDTTLDTQVASLDVTTSLLQDTTVVSNDTDRPEERRASCPEILPKPAGQILVRERNSLPTMPISPDFPPIRAPSSRASSTSLGSLRLSYTAAQLGQLLGYPDRGYTSRDDSSIRGGLMSPFSDSTLSPARRMPFSGRSHSRSRSYSSPGLQGSPVPGTPPPGNERRSRSIMDQSPLSTWLRSQGLRSTSPSFSGVRTSEDEQGSIKEAEVVYLRRCSSVQNLAVPESDLPRPEIVHLYDMDIHRQLATQAFNTPERSQSTSGTSGLAGSSVQHKPSGMGGSRKGGENVTPELDGASVPRVSDPDPAGIVTNSSSVYPSRVHTRRPTPNASSFHIPDWATNGKYPLPFTLPDFKWLENMGNPHTQSSPGSSPITTGGNTSASAGIDTCIQTQPTSPGLSSLTPSADVQSVTRTSVMEKSMGRFRLGHGAPYAILNRFHHKTSEERHNMTHKPSLLARLHLTLPRRVKLASRDFDSSGSEEQHQMPPLSRKRLFVDSLDRPVSTVTEKTEVSNPPHSPGALGRDDSARELWHRAICQEATQRTSSLCQNENHSRRSSFPDEKLHSRSTSLMFTLKHQSSVASYGMSDGISHAAKPPPTPARTSSRGTSLMLSPMKNDVLSAQSPASAQAQEHSPTKDLDRWTKYPSHTRAERNRATDQIDNLPNRDSVVTPVGDISMVKSVDSPHQTSKTGQRRMPGKIGKAVRSGISKLLPSRVSLSPGSPKSSKGGRKSSDCYKQSLEYPELALQDTEGDHRELKALEHEIKGLKCAPRSQVPTGLQGSKKVSLSAKMTALLHTDGPSELLTPTRPPLSHSRASTTTTDRFVTPLSSMSTNHDNSSFHSYPRSRPQSRMAIPFNGEALPEAVSDRDSVKSDTVLSRALLRSGTVSDVDSGFCGSTASAPKFETWNGRSRTHPFLSLRGMDQLDGIVGDYQPVGLKRGLLFASLNASEVVGVKTSDSVVSI
ncbi:hypothetical protein QBC34DRAFT_396077 [Podospora aff. communis PSN243]|uniref:Uncharacterized protein n=1 Tax=Podospora aff. communis PSN243 TaxID=3040156 RepID=A0AAV9GXC5_9PEZI|nr:hypothetical protein QBC34DRAFT_396077 [Podospora aff. communis PSN243]